MTPSGAPSATATQHSHIILAQDRPLEVEIREQVKGYDLTQLYPVAIAAIITMVGFYIVHSLSRRRDNEKAVAELFDRIVERSETIQRLAEKGWRTASAAERAEAVDAALWELQRLGADANLLSKRSKRLGWKAAMRRIDLGDEMSAFRWAVTGGDFEDENRGPNAGEAAALCQARNNFVGAAQTKVLGWF